MMREDFAPRASSWPEVTGGRGRCLRNNFTALECSERRVVPAPVTKLELAAALASGSETIVVVEDTGKRVSHATRKNDIYKSVNLSNVSQVSIPASTSHSPLSVTYSLPSILSDPSHTYP